MNQGFRTLGRETLKTGANIASDLAINDIPLKEAFKLRIRETRVNFKRKIEKKLDSMMNGSGYYYSKIAKCVSLVLDLLWIASLHEFSHTGI